MITVKEIAYTGYPVTDIARARAFYQELLRLTPGASFEHEGKHWIEYDIGSGTLAISNIYAGHWNPSSDGPCVALEVEDIDGAIAELRAAGVRFGLEPMDSGACRLAIVLDPDGNSVAIHRRHPGPKGDAT